MGSQPQRNFWQRRIARDEFLGLYFTVGLVLCLALMGVFGVLALEIRGPQPPSIDQRIYDGLRGHREAFPGVARFFRSVTELGDTTVLIALILTTGALLVWRRRWRLAPALALIVLMGTLLNGRIKNVFDRPRPEAQNAYIHETSYSFPSGHSMASMVAYGMLAYLALLALPPRRWVRGAGVTALALLIATIGFSRIYLAAHWFTDVLGGFALGAAWLALSITLLECVRRWPSVSRPRLETCRDS